jgi:hypothetical protein
MGYRHQLISDTMVPSRDRLPHWFIQKYGTTIDFDGEYWHSYDEHKMYGVWITLPQDVQRVIIDIGHGDIRLVYFADEGSLRNPDIIHVYIDKHTITEKLAMWP